MPKLTLRDLFAVVTIVALALGWWLDRSRLAERVERDRARMTRLELDNSWLTALLREYVEEVFVLREAATTSDQPNPSK